MHGIVIVKREAARAKCAHGMGNGIEKRKPAAKVDETGRHGKDHIHRKRERVISRRRGSTRSRVGPVVSALYM